MPIWIQDLIAVGVLLILAPAVAWIATRHGKRMRGNLIMAGILLGFGHPLDPPPHEKVEAAERGKHGPQPGEPPEV